MKCFEKKTNRIHLLLFYFFILSLKGRQFSFSCKCGQFLIYFNFVITLRHFICSKEFYRKYVKTKYVLHLYIVYSIRHSKRTAARQLHLHPVRFLASIRWYFKWEFKIFTVTNVSKCIHVLYLNGQNKNKMNYLRARFQWVFGCFQFLRLRVVFSFFLSLSLFYHSTIDEFDEIRFCRMRYTL